MSENIIRLNPQVVIILPIKEPLLGVYPIFRQTCLKEEAEATATSRSAWEKIKRTHGFAASRPWMIFDMFVSKCHYTI